MNRGMRNGRGQGLRKRDGSCLNSKNNKGFGRGQCRRRGEGLMNERPAALDVEPAESSLAGRFGRGQRNGNRP